ncbi:MAG: hypothetical protein ACYC99_17140 [Candidatus Geothermincolia bacterium]
MRRVQLPELNDQRWCPPLFRDTATDILRFTCVKTNLYGPMLPRLKAVLQTLNCHQILDLCSGGTGPILRIQEQLDRENYKVSVTLSDKFPNIAAFEEAAEASRCPVSYVEAPVDATDVPGGLRGFRTLFTSFHHFRPREARGILEDAARKREGIGIFEFTGRNPGIWVIMLISPLYFMLFMPFIKPFSWRKIFWTYVIPLFPLVGVWEGFASNMRTYSPEELKGLVESIDVEDYTWDIGMDQGTWDIGRIHHAGLHTITYRLGYPNASVNDTNSK